MTLINEQGLMHSKVMRKGNCRANQTEMGEMNGVPNLVGKGARKKAKSETLRLLRRLWSVSLDTVGG